MQAAGKLRDTRAICLLVLLIPLIGYAYSSPIQYLPNIPGYIPVYIRYGDEPLEGINPELAEAFGETSNSIKNLQKVDHTVANESDNFKDENIDAFMEESDSEHVYPLHIRAAESRSFASANEPEDPTKPKLLTIYTLPNDNERPRRRNRGRSRTKSSRKRPAFKANPLSDEEKEELEKLAIEVEKEETKPNEFYAPHGSPLKNSHKTHDLIAPIKVQVPLDESLTNIPKFSQADFSRSDDIAAKTQLPIKGLAPATILSNVNKISPIDLSNESETNQNTAKLENINEKLFNVDLLGAPRDTNFLKSEDEDVETDKNEPFIKVQRPAGIFSNVDKISPIDLPRESKSNEKKGMKDCTQHDRITTD